uniref:F-box domain-containing protein n=1 Tax=Oryza punctata TaxID=4537 RepID=A0A0E0LVM4_ORYPU
MADVQSPPPPSRQRRSVRPAMDALGSLPLDVLDNILSRLHIYDVVRSSALSRAWRRRWESLPTVGLLNSPGISASDVDALLLRRTAAARSFRLATRDRSWSLTAFHNWLLHLHRRGGLRDLELTLRYEFMYQKLNSCLFSFRDLTSLRLYCCGLPHLPAEFAGFPNLKTLHLSMVQVQSPGGRGIATLITASPVLQEASLIDAKLIGDGPDEDWVIRASNLRKLTIALGHKYGGRIEDIARLEECCLFGPNYAKYLMRMAHVTKLSFYCNSILSTEVDVLERLPFLFENLRSLVLGVFSDGTQEMITNDEFFNAQWVNHMFAKLHVVRMKKVSCLCNEMLLIEFILSKARALRVLSLTLASNSQFSIEEAITDITEYPRASPDAQGQCDDAQDIDANDEFLNAQSTNDMFVKLRVKVACLRNEMHFMEFVLNKARVLRVLSVYPSSGSTCSNEQAVIIITEHPRVSPDAQVIFMNRESTNNGYMHTSSVNYELETKRSGAWIDVEHPRKIHRLDLDAVDQQKQLEKVLLQTQKEGKKHKVEAQARHEDMKHRLKFCVAANEYFTSTLKYLSEKSNIPIPPFPDSSSVSSSPQPATSRSALTDPTVRSADIEQADSRTMTSRVLPVFVPILLNLKIISDESSSCWLRDPSLLNLKIPYASRMLTFRSTGGGSDGADNRVVIARGFGALGREAHRGWPRTTSGLFVRPICGI